MPAYMTRARHPGTHINTKTCFTWNQFFFITIRTVLKCTPHIHQTIITLLEKTYRSEHTESTLSRNWNLSSTLKHSCQEVQNHQNLIISVARLSLAHKPPLHNDKTCINLNQTNLNMDLEKGLLRLSGWSNQHRRKNEVRKRYLSCYLQTNSLLLHIAETGKFARSTKA